jgi:hypothetical protein
MAEPGSRSVTWSKPPSPRQDSVPCGIDARRAFVDLGTYASVVAMKPQMKDVFTRPETDPRYMPVTRDLSPAKRNMILRWLDTTGNAGQPNLGPSPLVVAAARPMTEVLALPQAASGPGGKTMAIRRKVGSDRQAAFQKLP